MTLKDIAKMSGCSISTVSKALKDSHEISTKTKKKISKIVNKYNYRPNFYASNLRKRRNLIIGVLLPNLRECYFLDLVIGITEETSKNGHRIMVYQSCEDIKKEKEYIELLSDDIVDGLIFCQVLNANRLKSNYPFGLEVNNYPIEVINKHMLTNNHYKESIGLSKAYVDGKKIARSIIDQIKKENQHLFAS